MKPFSCQYCWRAARLGLTGLGALEGMVCGLVVLRMIVGLLDACDDNRLNDGGW